MNISNSSSGNTISTAVWATTVRKITGLGTALGSSGNVNTSLANGTNVSFQPSAGSAGWLNVLGQATVNVTWQLTMTNGTTFEPAQTGASGAGVLQIGAIVGNGFFWNLANTGTASGGYTAITVTLLS